MYQDGGESLDNLRSFADAFEQIKLEISPEVGKKARQNFRGSF
jgi:hypothetical protein